MPKFSVLTSVYVAHDLKQKQLSRCHGSIMRQTFDDLEWILVDDGSPQDIPDVFPKTEVIKQKHLERIIALNRALEASKGEWLYFLDSDDELVSHGLECINQMIDKNPEAKIFNFSSIHVNQNYHTHIRGVFEPKKKKVGHEVFGGGNIVNGTFVIHRSVYEDLGGFPTDGRMWNPWDFSIKAQEEFPEIQKYFMVDHKNEPNKIAKELGNPWGNDFYIFYKYTRKYHSIPYNIPLVMIHHEGKKADGKHYVE